MPAESTISPLAVNEIEAGRLLGVSARTVFGLRESGKIRAVKLGVGKSARVLYPICELERFLKEQMEAVA